MRIAFLVFLFSGIAAAQTCPTLSADKTSALVAYVRKEYKLNDSVDLKLLEQESFGNTCYRALTFEGKTRVKTWQVTLYLSPDERFLTSELLDTTIDPQEAARRKAEALMLGLSENRGSSKGSDTAPVTIVEFSDFECPYCKKFTDILAQIWPEEKDEVRVVFHHMPLSIHPWARLAAEGAACAQLQNADAFWSMHDKIFQHQQEITADNVKQKLSEYAQNTKSLDTKSFQACLNNEMSLGLVFRDMNLASTNKVDATPTLYINGHHVPGVRDAQQLRDLIAEAKKEATQTGVSNIADAHR
jgi:protein-disulfide isomerase